jgi:threonine synthase
MGMKCLECLKCGTLHSPQKGLYICKECGGKLKIIYDYDEISRRIDKKTLEHRPHGMWKYKELLPVTDTAHIVTLGEGGTPLIRAENLSKMLGLRLFLKDETQNPTGSFKDRPMSVGISKAHEFGASSVVTASSGNAAIALAAYAAKAAMTCYAFMPIDVPEAKMAQLSVYGAIVIKSIPSGKEDPCYELMTLGWNLYDWHPVPSCGAFNPYHPEGSKTISYEICEQLQYEVPDWVFIPMGAGTLLSGNAKGYFEFKDLGFIDEVPRLAGIQAEGCAPIVKGFRENTRDILLWENPNTIAGGLVDPYPWDADTAISAIKKTKGTAKAVSDHDIICAQKILAKTEGIFAEPSAAAGLAGLRTLVADGTVDHRDCVVVEITGTGLKDYRTALQYAPAPPQIQPHAEHLEKALRKIKSERSQESTETAHYP